MGPRVILAVLAVGHMGFGVWALAAPDRVAAMVEMSLRTAGATGEVRAVYGGLMLALGLALARGAMGGARAGSWLSVVALGYGGLVLGRAVSLATDGASGYTLLAMAFEALVGAFVGWTATQAGRPARPEPAAPGVGSRPSSPR